jgi:hypothetical protein
MDVCDNQRDELLIFTLLSYHTSTCFGPICSPLSERRMYIYIYIYIYIYTHTHTYIYIYTGYSQNNGGVSNVNKKSIFHLTRVKRTPSAVTAVQVSHVLTAVRFSCA